MSKKEEFLKERFKQALDSTYKVISEELHNLNKKENPKNVEDYKISNLKKRKINEEPYDIWKIHFKYLRCDGKQQ